MWGDNESCADLTGCGQSLSKLSFHFAISIFEWTATTGSLPESESVEASSTSTAGIVAHIRILLSEWLPNISVATSNSAFVSSFTFIPEFAAERKARSHARRILQECQRLEDSMYAEV